MYEIPTRPTLPAQGVASTLSHTEMRIGSKVEGKGPAVVLLHSSMASKSQWRSLMESMRGTHRLIAIDLHGYGDNPMPESGERHSLADEVMLVKSKLAQLLAPWEGYHLVGHSFGGGVALRLAHATPERVRSLTLYEPTAFHLLARNDSVLDELSAVANAAQAAVHEGERADATQAFIDFWGGKGTYAALPPARQAQFAALLPKIPLDFDALTNDPMRVSDYGRMAIPSCLIAGRHSPACAQAIFSVLAANLRNGETHQVDAGHMAPVSHPALVNPIIEAFINRIDGRGMKPAKEAAN
jgi:pimeloyl-ACP methyl ester carboxylesterase